MLKGAGAIIGYAACYLALGIISFSTAFVQTNTAAVWIPSGFSVGLLLARGIGLWPAVSLGAFALNFGCLVLSTPTMSLQADVLVAGAIAIGNTGEALAASYLAKRFAGGVALLSRPTNVALFATIVATIPSLISMVFGVTASRGGGVAAAGSVVEIAWTWYLANSVGILIFTGPTLALLAVTALV